MITTLLRLNPIVNRFRPAGIDQILRFLRMNFHFLIFFFLGSSFFFAPTSQAGILSFYPYSFYLSHYYENSQRASLKDSCYGLLEQDFFSSCNVASYEIRQKEVESSLGYSNSYKPYRPYAKDSSEFHIGASIFFGQDFSSIYNYQQELQNKKYNDFSREIIADKRSLEFNGSLPLFWKSQHWAITLIPEKVNYFSYRIGDANPYFFLYYNKETSLSLAYKDSLPLTSTSFSVASNNSLSNNNFDSPSDYDLKIVNKNWSYGLRGKLTHREIIMSEFTLLDMFTNPSNALPLKEQDYFFLEPGLTYQWYSKEASSQNHWFSSWFYSWKPRVSWNLVNVGISKNPDPKTDPPPYSYLSFGWTPPTEEVYLDFATTYRYSLRNLFPTPHEISIGGIFKYGLLELLWNASQENKSLGIYAQFWSLRTGLIYENIKPIEFAYQTKPSSYSDSSINENKESILLEFSLVL